ncbi:hypothetical protein BIW11_08792 [Tropilaelaps mercedesae]|uniref:Uncharacterized protein n=1 Tax=Tropilaelaps mercedesae TaxID=418985 RepID=A0A1V9XMY8_9ACAR|nr:hypothetical protein BIW11_08792 [Tropilaelaps mercedesae]
MISYVNPTLVSIGMLVGSILCAWLLLRKFHCHDVLTCRRRSNEGSTADNCKQNKKLTNLPKSKPVSENSDAGATPLPLKNN